MKTEQQIRDRYNHLTIEYGKKLAYSKKLELHHKITELMFVLGD